MEPDPAFSVPELERSIEKARHASPLAASHVVLLGASKGQNGQAIAHAIAAGVMHFGENKVQEAQAKWPELRARYPKVKLHLIGALQRNKAEEAVALFDVIETLDSVKLAEALATAMQKQGRQMECYLQVNSGREAQKAGVAVEELPALLAHANHLGLNVTGLMAVPPQGLPPAPHFALLRKLALRHGLSKLSMGMSGDFETAVRMGATEVRIGSALFGERVR